MHLKGAEMREDEEGVEKANKILQMKLHNTFVLFQRIDKMAEERRMYDEDFRGTFNGKSMLCLFTLKSLAILSETTRNEI